MTFGKVLWGAIVMVGVRSCNHTYEKLESVRSEAGRAGRLDDV